MPSSSQCDQYDECPKCCVALRSYAVEKPLVHSPPSIFSRFIRSMIIIRHEISNVRFHGARIQSLNAIRAKRDRDRSVILMEFKMFENGLICDGWWPVATWHQIQIIALKVFSHVLHFALMAFRSDRTEIECAPVSSSKIVSFRFQVLLY